MFSTFFCIWQQPLMVKFKKVVFSSFYHNYWIFFILFKTNKTKHELSKFKCDYVSINMGWGEGGMGGRMHEYILPIIFCKMKNILASMKIYFLKLFMFCSQTFTFILYFTSFCLLLSHTTSNLMNFDFENFL